ncbi:uncharacterized protein MELLADRAFT_92928 [Melampsora larici-populina 98AG31]|uniref:Uncharacterized protein n=1 Tax=Melampsora larici-populina (strain 98AG31 / pathotype 3-4-7) TaxID=747676 RepID=F4S3A0_MELLP|nr:uncharacterized protein MELLADRAFT_92928 [Melampsora larici-populina 98AG31]EGG00877.1 hypothetical protein MELLADRAFT_92928 [Melampsora larici-populina 98AG31]
MFRYDVTNHHRVILQFQCLQRDPTHLSHDDDEACPVPNGIASSNDIKGPTLPAPILFLNLSIIPGPPGSIRNWISTSHCAFSNRIIYETLVKNHGSIYDMSEPNPCTGHGLYMSGIFEVEEQLSEDRHFKVEFRSYSVLIGCAGANRKQDLHYEIRATGFSNEALKLEPNKLYFLRGSFFPTNTEETYKDEFFFEGSDRLCLGTPGNFSDSLADKIGITGIGRVLNVTFVVEDSMQYLKQRTSDPDKISLYAIVQHCDFHPDTKLAKEITLEYRIPPFKHLSGSPQVVKEGRECQFHGYIKDFNEETSRYIVIVAPTSGHVEKAPRARVVKGETSTEPNGRPKIVKRYDLDRFKPRGVSTPFKSPMTVSESSPTIPFPPSAQLPSSYSSGSGQSGSMAPAAQEPAQPTKKRARAQPKRRVAKAVEPEWAEE